MVFLMQHEGKEEPVAAVHLSRGKIKVIPLENCSDDPENYFVTGNDFALLQLTGEVLYVVHAHPDNCTPSEYDIAACNAINIPYLVFDMVTLNHTEIKPYNYKTLSGKSYEFGTQDCFETARDWYLMHGVPVPGRKKWVDDWWTEGHDYIRNVKEEWPFVPANGLEYGTLITFAVESDVENHLGIYLDNDIFFHHAVDRYSCKENLYPFWGKYIRNIYNHEAGNLKRLFRG